MQNTKTDTPTQDTTNAPPTGNFRALSDYGFSIFPLLQRSKKPAVKWEPYQTARPTPDEIETWEHEHERRNVAVICGAVSGVVVLDIDSDEGQQEAERRGLPQTPSVKTGKGRHYYFKHPGFEVHNFAKGRGGKEKMPGIDFRGDGGYVVGAGSIHESGAVYHWDVSPDECEFAEMPSWLSAYLKDEEKNERKGTTTARTDAEAHPNTGRFAKYVQTALDNETQKIRSAPVGERNDTLNRAAFNIGQLVGGGYLTDAEALHPLTAAGLDAGLETNEVLDTVQSGLNAGKKEPRTIPDTTAREDPDDGGGPLTWRLTDMGNSERLAHHHGNKLRYNHTRKCWLIWDGTRWATDVNNSKAEALAKKTARGILNEARQCKGDAYGDILKHAARSENAAKIAGMLKLATSDQSIAVTQDKMDVNGWLLNLKNGTYDLQSETFRKHEQADLLTKVSPVAYDPAATCPKWLQFLNRIFANDAELIFFIQQALGYTLTAETTEQCFFLLWGAGRNGKSTLMNLIQWLLGDYSQAARVETLMIKRNENVGDDLAVLDGARLVAAMEGEQGRRLAEGLVKQLTGGDKVTARFLYGMYFNFEPRFKIWLATNHKPGIRGSELAIWRRVKLVPFTVTIPENEVDPYLPDKLKAEGPGILNWLLQGCASWREKGLITPEVVRAATEAYRAEMDILSDWLAESCEVGPRHVARFSALFASYQKWCEENSERTITKKAFGMALSERGFDSGTIGANVKTRLGLRVISEDEILF